MPEDNVADSKNALRLILVGVGSWGETWIRVVRESPRWELAGLVDKDEAALARAASSAALDPSKCFGSIAAALDAVESDAALIAVPPAVHAALALEALDGGLHCLIEKPFAASLQDAAAVVERGSAAGRVVMVNQQYRFRPGARTVSRLVETGVVGRIGAVYVDFSNELAVRGFQHEMDEPLLWDMAIHHFDLMRGVLGLEPARVQATSSNPAWSTFTGNAAATAVFETDDGVGISYEGTFAPRGRITAWDGVWDILCENGSIRWSADEVVVLPLERPLRARIERKALRREWKGQHIRPSPLAEPDRLGSLAEFASAILERREPETSGRDNVGSLALTVAAVASAQTRATVEIADLV